MSFPVSLSFSLCLSRLPSFLPSFFASYHPTFSSFLSVMHVYLCQRVALYLMWLVLHSQSSSRSSLPHRRIISRGPAVFDLHFSHLFWRFFWLTPFDHTHTRTPSRPLVGLVKRGFRVCLAYKSGVKSFVCRPSSLFFLLPSPNTLTTCSRVFLDHFFIIRQAPALRVSVCVPKRSYMFTMFLGLIFCFFFAKIAYMFINSAIPIWSLLQSENRKSYNWHPATFLPSHTIMMNSCVYHWRLPFPDHFVTLLCPSFCFKCHLLVC